MNSRPALRGLGGQRAAKAAVFACVPMAMLSGCAGPGALPPDRVRVSAAVSLTGPLERAADDFRRETGVAVELNLAGSSTLAAQIRAGAPVDLFISADERQMDRVASDALIDTATRVVLLSNRLAVVVPAGAPAPRRPAELSGPAFARIAVGDPAGVPAGVYARGYLESLGLWNALSPRLAPMRSVRAALAVVEAADADAGVVYRTDALSSDDVDVAFEVPEHEGPPIAYPAAVLTEAPNAAGAARFLAWLQRPAARDAFAQAGFVVPQRAPAAGPPAGPSVVPKLAPTAGPPATPFVVPKRAPADGSPATPTAAPKFAPVDGPATLFVVPKRAPAAGPPVAP